MASDNFLFFGKYPATVPAVALTGNLTIVGESQDPTHIGAVELTEFSFGVENPNTIGSATSGAGSGKAKFDEFTIKKGVDLASPNLFQACGQGCHFPFVQLTVRKAGGTKLDYLTWTFAMVYVTKVEWSGGSGEDAPEENVTFVYGAMQVQYTQQDATGQPLGTSEVAWSQVLNNNTLAVVG